MEQKILELLTAIAEGYKVTGHYDRFVVVDNPKYSSEDAGRFDSHLVTDIHEYEKYLKDKE